MPHHLRLHTSSSSNVQGQCKHQAKGATTQGPILVNETLGAHTPLRFGSHFDLLGSYFKTIFVTKCRYEILLVIAKMYNIFQQL